MKKFGFVLTSRESGHEALAAFRPSLAGLSPEETVSIDFDGVYTLSPSWADEFLTPLKQQFGDRLRLEPSDNPSVKATVALLEKIYGFRLS